VKLCTYVSSNLIGDIRATLSTWFIPWHMEQSTGGLNTFSSWSGIETVHWKDNMHVKISEVLSS
jgi:hypothetical protein